MTRVEAVRPVRLLQSSKRKTMVVRRGYRSGGVHLNTDKFEFSSYILVIVKGKLCCRGIMKSILSPIK